MRYSRSNREIRNAFTLLEVVVGLALMASVLVASLLSFSAHRKQIRAADARIAAVTVADDLLQQFSVRPEGLPRFGRGPIPGYPNWIWQSVVVGNAAPVQVPMHVIRFSIMEVGRDSELEELVWVNVMEAAK